MIAEQYVQAYPPPLLGGQPPSGTYHATAASILTDPNGGASGPTGNNRQQTLLVSGGSVESIEAEQNGDRVLNQNVSVCGALLTVQTTCSNVGGSVGTGVYEYNWDPVTSALTVYTGNGTREEPVFTLATAGSGTYPATPGCDASPYCGGTPNRATAVQTTQLDVAAPATYAGGTLIADGTYVATEDVLLTGVGGQTGAYGSARRYTLVKSGSTIQVVDANNWEIGLRLSGSYTYAAATGLLTYTIACPTGQPFTGQALPIGYEAIDSTHAYLYFSPLISQDQTHTERLKIELVP